MNKNIQHQNNVAIIGQSFTYPSPLPPPEILEKYEKIMPGLVEEIISMTNIQGNHRRELEATKLKADITHQQNRDTEAMRGMFFAFFISIFFLLIGSYTALHGAEFAGSIFGVSGVGGIVYAFIHGRKSK